MIEWYYPESGKGVDKSINDIVTHFPKLDLAIHSKASSLAAQAQARLAAHHRSGAAKVEVDRHPRASARTPDWYVYLRDADPGGKWRNSTGKGKASNIPDRSVMSIEFGWIQTHAFGKKLPAPIPHDGLGILSGVMNRAAQRYSGPR
jgi:hypothetical protein